MSSLSSERIAASVRKLALSNFQMGNWKKTKPTHLFFVGEKTAKDVVAS